MKEEKRNIYVLNDYNVYNDSGDIIEVSPEDFSAKYPTILHPRLIIMPVQADPAGITQYVRIRNENLIYFFKKARIQYQLKIEYFYDEEVEPIILDPIKLEITNPSQLYQALWNIERIRFLFSIMDNGKDNENGPGSLGINGDTIRILDVCSFKIDIIGSNQGDIHYEYYERKENTKGRYLIADEIMNQLLHTSFMYDPSNSFQYMEAIACDFDNMQWLFTESLCDIEDFDALFPSENGACIFCKPQDYQYLESFTQKRKRENFYDPCLSGDIVIFDSSKTNGNRIFPQNIDMIGNVPTSDGIIDFFRISDLDISTILPLLIDIHFIAQSIILFEKAFEENDHEYIEFRYGKKDPSELNIAFFIHGECDNTHMLNFKMTTDENFSEKSGFVEFVKAIERMFT